VQARSIATRTALLDAAVECLCAHGYASVTTTEIAGRAGVSRGAQLHHFPTKAELLAAAVEHLLQRRLQEFGEVLAGAAPRLDRLDAAVDVLWTMFEGPAFAVWVELWIASRTDPDLAATMAEVDRRFTDESRLMFIEVASGFGAYDPKQLEMVRDFTFAVMTGVALQRLVPRGQRPASDYLDMLKALAPSMLAAPAPDP
jgi:AcrR family transcriptional regulator